MGERARGLEALVIASPGEPATETDICERAQDLAWCRHWWTKLLPAMRIEEQAMQSTRNSACENGSANEVVTDTVHSSQAPTEAISTQPEQEAADQEREQEVLAEDEYQQ